MSVLRLATRMSGLGLSARTSTTSIAARYTTAAPAATSSKIDLSNLNDNPGSKSQVQQKDQVVRQ